MPDFGRVITMAYMRILGRPPDPGGLENYNRLMNSGMTEAQMRESLIRSGEYANKNPGGATATPTTSTARKKSKPSRKRAATKKTAPARKKAKKRGASR